VRVTAKGGLARIFTPVAGKAVAASVGEGITVGVAVACGGAVGKATGVAGT